MTNRVTNWKSVGCSILLVGLMLLSGWVNLVDNENMLEESTIIQRISGTDTLTSDTQTNSSLPTNTYGNTANLMIGDADFTDARLLVSFDLVIGSGGVLPATATVESASLNLLCSRFSVLPIGGTIIYPAMLLTGFNESNANHNESDTGVNWSTPGADGLGLDRAAWEPGASVTISSSSSVSVNITALVQDALNAGRTNMSLTLSALGQPVFCASSEHPTTASRPSLDFEYSLSGTPNNQGAVTVDGPASGSILADSSELAIRANLHPTITWSNLIGSGLEIQFSNGDDFRSIVDGDWLWNSWDDSSSFSLTNEEFDTPNSNISSGSWVHFRMRSANDTILGPWTYGGVFGLPSDVGTVDLNGKATVVLSNDSIGLGFRTLQDSWMLSGNSTYNGVEDFRFRIGHSNDSNELQMRGIVKITMEQVPIASNITLEEATLNFRRTDRNGSALISLWALNSSNHVLSELNWDNSSNGVQWNGGNAGALPTNFANYIDTVEADQSFSTLSWDVTTEIQNYLRDGHQGDIDFLLTGHGLPGEEIEFASSDIDATSYRPHLDLVYNWGDGAATSSPTGVYPDNAATWEVINWSLNSTNTPTLTWDVTLDSSSNPNDVIISLVPSGGDAGTGMLLTADSRTNNGFDLSNGEYTIPSGWNLEYGQKYLWRIQVVEDDERGPWHSTELIVTQLNSTSIGNGEHELRFRHGIGSTNHATVDEPQCSDTFIESGTASNMNLDGMDLAVSSTQVTLIACDTSSHQLPDGLAVVAATLRLRTENNSAPPIVPRAVVVHESEEHAWVESSVTWNTTDGTTLWNGAGASGSERITALDSVDVQAASTWYEWNVTGAVQRSMRAGTSSDFIVTSQSSDILIFNDRLIPDYSPELVIVYTNGSNGAPATPVDLTPGNGDWILSGDFTFEVDRTPTLSWNATGATVANGWQVQVDSSSSFDSSNFVQFSSWIDSSSFSGATFTFASDLSEGDTFYWRVRGTSATGQIGSWSAPTHFVIPNLDVSQVCTTCESTKVTMGHGDILSDGSMPLFTDTWISWAPSSLNDTHADEDTLFISGTSSTLIEIPIDGIGALPHPSNAKLLGASISFQVLSNNSSTPAIAIYETLQDWNSSATGLAYDGTTNWSTLGGSGVQDRSEWIDVVIDQAASTRMVLDISEIVQAAIDRGDDSVGLMLSVEANSNDRIVLASTETQFDANEPELSLTWQNGTATPLPQAATIVSPANGDILWDFPSMSAVDEPLYSWSHPAASNVTDWRIFVTLTDDGPWGLQRLLDTRISSSGAFDMTNMTAWTPLDPLDQDEDYSWIVQPIQDGMYGPRSAVDNFIVPNDTGDAINSTDYWVDLANGNAYSTTGEYDVAQGAHIDSCTPTIAYGNYNTALSVGRSNGGPSCNNHESRTLMRFDISNVPIMDNDPWQVIDAEVYLYRTGGSSIQNTNISVSDVYCNWDEGTVTWNDCATNNTWQISGANGANDADIPLTMTNVSGNGWYSWNVTQLLQQARNSGSDTLNLLFSSEDPNLYARHSFVNEHATLTNEEYRPLISIKYRAGVQSMPTTPSWDSWLTTNSPFTAWDTNELRPTPLDPLNASWTHPSANTVDAWQIQVAKNERFTSGVTIVDSSDSGTWGSASFDLTNLTLLESASAAQGDYWNHLRVRAVQDGIYSNWSVPFQTRVPEEQGSDDGAGNYTVTMQRGAVFVDTGLLPSMPDTWIASNSIGQTQNHGSDSTIAVGIDPGSPAHDAVGLVSIDLSEYPYPATMLPTSVTLRMYVASISGSGAHSIAIHDCSAFSESSATWGNFNPNSQCTATAASSMTATSANDGVWYEWDVTGLARSSWASTGVMSMALKTTWSGTISFTSAEGSVTYAPKLIVDYVDNPNNASSPAQVSLLSPTHLEVIYGVDAINNILDIETRPMLTWDTLSDATGYVLHLTNESGTQTYKSWDSNSNSGFMIGTAPANSYWMPDFDLAVGEIYTWSVQALNDSVPGPQSVPWTFGVGNPDITDVGNYVYSIEIQEGADVEALGHLPIWDAHISAGNPDTAHGNEDIVQIGRGCDSGSANHCHGIYEIDMSQMGALNSLSVNTHSSTLSIYMDSISEYNMANYIDLTAYAMINPNYDEIGATWNAADIGINWNASGLQSGVDYSSTALDTVRVHISAFSAGWIEFDVSGAMTGLNGSVSILIIGTPNAGEMVIDFISSEDGSQLNRPFLHFNYTIVDSISLSGPTTTDADTPVSFSGNLLDVNSAVLPGALIWSASDGTIDSNGYFTPDNTGIVEITASFGQVTISQNITVAAGAPVTLIATPLAIQIDADTLFELDQLKVVDANGNVVPGETITLESSNGTIYPGTSVTTPIASASWEPWTVGLQYLNVTWGTQTISIPITVTVGAPNFFVIFGNTGIEAGNSTSYDLTVHDQRGNLVDRSQSGTLTWGAMNGEMVNATGEYTGNLVGQWTIWADSDLGISSTFEVTVTYGDIADLKLTGVSPTNTVTSTSSSTSSVSTRVALTADEEVELSLLRIDVRGNEEPFDLAASGWTWDSQKGTLYVGSPVIWNTSKSVESSVIATLEGVTATIWVSTTHGSPIYIEANSTETVLVSGDTRQSILAFAYDSDGNRWSDLGGQNQWQWTLITNPNDPNPSTPDPNWLLSENVRAYFYPSEASGDYPWTVQLLGYDYSDYIEITVVPGELQHISIASAVQITADDTFNLAPGAADGFGNELEVLNLQWAQRTITAAPTLNPANCLSAEWEDITNSMRSNNFVWEATEIGMYEICAHGGSNSNAAPNSTSVEVDVGAIVTVWHQSYVEYSSSGGITAPVGDLANMASTSITAGDTPFVAIWVKDSDNNVYSPSEVAWTIDGNSVESYFIVDLTSADYSATFIGTNNQTYSLSYTVDDGISGTWEVNVAYAKLYYLIAVVNAPGVESAKSITVDQQTTVTITASGFDEYDNQVPISLDDIFSSDDGTELNDVTLVDEITFEIYMLNEGKNSYTVLDGITSDHPQREGNTATVEIEVGGTIAGFFEANSPWSWIGLSFAVILLLGVVLIVVIIARRARLDDDEYDTDDMEYPEDDYSEMPEAPSSPQVSEESPSEEEYSTEDDPNYKVDEDGTEWWEDDDGVWWYRDPDMADWEEWKE